MQGVPEQITLSQIQAAARALGLPLECLRSFSADLHEVVADVYVLNADGNKIRHGNDMVSVCLTIPVNREVPDAAAQH